MPINTNKHALDRIVIPVVVGSSPIGHPTRLNSPREYPLTLPSYFRNSDTCRHHVGFARRCGHAASYLRHKITAGHRRRPLLSLQIDCSQVVRQPRASSISPIDGWIRTALVVFLDRHHGHRMQIGVRVCALQLASCGGFPLQGWQ